MIPAGLVLSVTALAVALNYPSRVLMPVRALWARCFAAGALADVAFAVIGVVIMIRPETLPLQQLGGLLWFSVAVGVTTLTCVAVLRGNGGGRRPGWLAAAGIAALAHAGLSAVRAGLAFAGAAFGSIQKAGA